MRDTYEIKCKRATMNPRYAHSYFTNFVNWSRQWITMHVSDQRRAQFDFYISPLDNQVLYLIHLAHLNEANRVDRCLQR